MNWWNQWFYDHPPDLSRYKVFDLQMDVVALPATVWRGTELIPILYEATLEYTINCSTPDYPDDVPGIPGTGPGGPPPLPSGPPYEEPYIERLPAQQVVVKYNPENPITPTQISWAGEILDFNPEWISIDVRVIGWKALMLPGEQWDLAPTIAFNGTLDHCCIPIPAAAWLGVPALGIVMIRRVRRRAA